MELLKLGIRRLGEDLVRCGRKCDSVVNHPAEGVIPRGLILEYEQRKGEDGVIVVGINPRKASDEACHYRSKVISYESCVEFWMHERMSDRYHGRIREIVDSLGFCGPILWTELVKCESEKKGEKPQMGTIETCAGSFLKNEVATVPNWPIMTIAWNPYCYCDYVFRERTVIGIPHPTGDPHFWKIAVSRTDLRSVRKAVVIKTECKDEVERRRKEAGEKPFRISPREMIKIAMGEHIPELGDHEARCSRFAYMANEQDSKL